MTYKIIVHSQQDMQSSRLFKDTDKIYICISTVYILYAAIQLQWTSNMYPTELKPWNISHKPALPSTLPAADRVSRESKQHTDSRDFILAAGGLPLIPPGYIYRCGWRSEGMPVVVTLSYCTHVSHCVSEQLPVPIMNVEEQREAGRKWLTVL